MDRPQKRDGVPKIPKFVRTSFMDDPFAEKLHIKATFCFSCFAAKIFMELLQIIHICPRNCDVSDLGAKHGIKYS